MKLLKRSWDEVSIDDYHRIRDILDDEALNETERGMAILSVLCDVDEEAVWELPVEEARALFKQVEWIGNFSFNKGWSSKVYMVGNVKCDVQVNVSKMSVAQYIDFQTYFKEDMNDIARILSVILVPQGKKYGEGYDMEEFIKLISKYVPITEANAMCFFFIMKSVDTIRTMRIYSAWMEKVAETEIAKSRRKREKRSTSSSVGSL